MKAKEAGPGSHTPKVNFIDYNTSSSHRFSGQTVFGKDARRALEDRHRRYLENPGPG